MTRAYLAKVVSLVCVAAALSGCRRSSRPVSTTWFDMGTFCSVSVPARDAARLPGVAALSRTTVSNLNAMLTVYSPDSEISQINRVAGESAVSVSPETGMVLALCIRYADLTGGAFDPTVGAMVRLWGFNDGNPPAEPLPESAIREVMEGIGYRRIRLDGDTVFLDDARADLDLGGIAKGYAADICHDRVMASGASNTMINLGGNIRCSGEARPGRPWTIGVRNPFDRDEILGSLSLTGGDAVATSGNYERFVTIGGKRYAHIIDPRSGCPVEGMAGVTVVAKSAVEADALSTALFVMGEKAGAKVVADLSACSALFVPDRQPIEILITPGFVDRFKPSERFARAVHVIEPIESSSAAMRPNCSYLTCW